MEKQREEEKVYLIWIDNTEKILSFRCAEGFEELCYPTHEALLAYAVEKCSQGYRIQ